MHVPQLALAELLAKAPKINLGSSAQKGALVLVICCRLVLTSIWVSMLGNQVGGKTYTTSVRLERVFGTGWPEAV